MQKPKLRIPIRQDHNKPIMTDNLRTVPAELDQAETPEGMMCSPDRASIGTPLQKLDSINNCVQMTNLSYEYLRYLCTSGKIKYIRCGRKYMIVLESLARFIESGGADK